MQLRKICRINVLHFDMYVFFIAVLGSGLTSNFETVVVEIVDCPDLTKEPFTLACKGENCR
jgi:hypothetical protein